jgi:hypothetical protein
MPMFSNDMKKKLKKHNEVLEKIFSRISAFEEYKKQSLKKSTPLSILKDLKTIRSHSEKPHSRAKELKMGLLAAIKGHKMKKAKEKMKQKVI